MVYLTHRVVGGVEMSYNIDMYSLNRLPGQSLAVIQCGFQRCDAGHSCGPYVYDYYSVHFIIEGKGKYMVDGREYELSAGQGFIITPGISTTYIADEKQPWKYIYATFTGADDDVLVRNAGLEKPNVVFDFPLDDSMMRDLMAMHEASKSFDALGYDVIAYFLLVMSRLVRANINTSSHSIYPEYYIKKAVYYIENNYNRSISIEDIAKFVGIERTYLYKLFKEYLYASPSTWLKEFRLKRAVKMMENNSLSINEIAYHTGFYDVSHFYRAFLKKYNVTPKKYRSEYYKQETKKD